MLTHLVAALAPGGLLCSAYNQRPNSFSNRFLTYQVLDERVRGRGVVTAVIAEVRRPPDDEVLAVHVWRARGPQRES